MIKNRFLIFKITLWALFLLVSVFLCVFIADLDRKATVEYKTYRPTEVIDRITGWQYHWGDSPVNSDGNFEWLDSSASDEGWIDFQFPGRPENPEKYKAIWIKVPLPDTSVSDPFIKFRLPQQSVEVYLESQLIYKYGEFDTAENVRTLGSTWHFVQLPPDYAGKTMTLRISTPFPQYAGYISQPVLGSLASLYLDILRFNIIYLIFGILFVFAGGIILLIQLLGPREWHDLKYLALAAIFIGVWYILDTNIIQIFFDLPVSTTYLLHYFSSLAPVWLLIYFERRLAPQSPRACLVIRALWILFAAAAFAAFALDMLNLVSVLYYSLLFNYLMVIGIVCIVLIAVNEIRKGRHDHILLLSGLLALGLTGLFDNYWQTMQTSPETTIIKLSHASMFYFLITLLICTIMEFNAFYSKLENILNENETNYKSLFTNMADGFVYSRLEYDQEGAVKCCKILEANDAFVMETGKPKEELIGSDLFEIYPAVRNKALNSIKKYNKEAGVPEPDISDETAASSDPVSPDDIMMLGDKWYRVSAFCPIEGSLNIIFSDISAIKKAEETIRHQAYTDNMTGFFSRTYFEEILAGMNSMLDVVKPLSIIAIDIDGLKITNDTFGHDAGDNLIRKAARILTDVFGADTPIARIGGDEFCVILPCTDFAAAQVYAEQIVKMTEDSNSRNSVIPISMSIGIASSDEDSNEDIYCIYRRADDDMYRYKMSQTSSEKSKIIDMLLTALSEKDYVSQGHVERISELCLLLAESLNLHENQKRDLVLLSKVHDLGKIGIPDDILNKPSKLTAKEYERMKLHVKIGYNIASRSRELVTIAPLILHHHEHWNGKGYPDSLQGEKIPLECRILAIVDAFDAMTSDRPYHKGISVEEALAEIERCAGTQFDPELAMKFVEKIRNSELGSSDLSGSRNLSGAPV